MLFKPELITKILSGNKTMTRRPVKSGQYLALDGRVSRYNEYYVLSNERELWRQGKDYAVCPGRGKPQVARITVLAIRRERLADISDADAKAEGFPHAAAFIAYWIALYGSFQSDLPVWVLSFSLKK